MKQLPRFRLRWVVKYSWVESYLYYLYILYCCSCFEIEKVIFGEFNHHKCLVIRKTEVLLVLYFDVRKIVDVQNWYGKYLQNGM